MFYAAPLYAALSLCAMPCCARAQSAATLTSAMASCPTPCTVSADDNAEPAVATPAPQRAMTSVATLAIVTITSAMASPERAQYASSPPRAPDAPLYVLNSLFRI